MDINLTQPLPAQPRFVVFLVGMISTRKRYENMTPDEVWLDIVSAYQEAFPPTPPIEGNNSYANQGTDGAGESPGSS